MCKHLGITMVFFIVNVGLKLAFSKVCMLTNVAYQFGPDKPVYYAMEGYASLTGLDRICIDTSMYIH